MELNTEQPDPKDQNHLREAFLKFKDFLYHTLNFREGSDISGTIEGIKKDIDFKGPSVWILICSIFIASIGLNVNSAPAIIGAMLISPLMGPILGVGLSIGTNDWQTLKRSLNNVGIAVVVSMLTSYVYFTLTPLQDIQSELLARTNPTILDVMIALFGGFAGIIAGSRKEKTNVIPGVAIATALMPPLCTAGYGLAMGNWKFFFGAFYLFFINSVIICMATFLIVRYLHFPLVSWVNAKSKRKYRIYLSMFLFVIVIPSAIIFFDVIKESIFTRNAEKFISENFHLKETEVINKNLLYADSVSSIEVFLIGEPLDAPTQTALRNKLPDYGLENTKLTIFQNKDISNNFQAMEGAVTEHVKTGIIEEMYRKNEALMQDKDEKIKYLENELISIQQDSLPRISLKKEVAIQYPFVQQMLYANAQNITNKKERDVPSILVHFSPDWKKKNRYKKREVAKDQLKSWLQVRLKLDTLILIEY